MNSIECVRNDRDQEVKHDDVLEETCNNKNDEWELIDIYETIEIAIGCHVEWSHTIVVETDGLINFNVFFNDVQIS